MKGKLGRTATSELIGTLDKTLPPALKRLLKLGASKSALKETERVSGAPIFGSLRRVYEWHNGAQPGIGLIPQYHFLSLEWIATEIKVREQEVPTYCFPLFDDGGGDFLYFDLREGEHSTLYLWLRDNLGETIVAFDSLEAFLLSVSDAWAAGVFRVAEYEDENGMRGGRKWHCVEFTDYHQHRRWNDIFCNRNPIAVERSGQVAILNTPFLLDLPPYPESELFTEDEYYGLAQSFPSKNFQKHWAEFLKTGQIASIPQRGEIVDEMEWFDQILPGFVGTLNQLRKAGTHTQRIARLDRQIRFLRRLQKALAQIQTNAAKRT